MNRTSAELRSAVEVLGRHNVQHRGVGTAVELLDRHDRLNAARRGRADTVRAQLVADLANGVLDPDGPEAVERYSGLVATRLRERPGAVGLAGSADPFAAAARHCVTAAHQALRTAGTAASKAMRARLDDGASDCRKLARRLGDSADRPLDVSADRKTVSDRLDLEERRRQVAQLRADLDVLLDLDIIDRVDGEMTARDRVNAHFRLLGSGKMRYTLSEETAEQLAGRPFTADGDVSSWTPPVDGTVITRQLTAPAGY